MVRPRPYISQQSVRKILDSMARGTLQNDENSLLYLTLVDEFLCDPLIPQMEAPREFAVSHILADLITQHLLNCRHGLSLNTPSEHKTSAEASHAFFQDLQTRSPELIGWSLLYYRYVRVEFNLFAVGYPTGMGIEERTFRRYQASAVKRLTETLVEAEYAARERQRRLYLSAALPETLQTPLVGRDTLLEEVERLRVASVPAWIAITGPKGVGKSAFVQALLRRQIDQSELDQIVWISEPQSVEFIYWHLRQVLLPDSLADLRLYLARMRVAIVLDGITSLSRDLDGLRLCLESLSSAIVYIVNSTYLYVSPKVKHVVLSPLEKHAARALVRYLLPNLELDEDVYFEELWSRVGGNPLAIQLMVNRNINQRSVRPLVTEDVLNELFEQSYQTLSRNGQDLLFLIAMSPDAPISVQSLSEVLPPGSVTDAEVAELMSGGLVGVLDEHNHIRLYDAVRDHVKLLYVYSEPAKQACNRVIEAISESLTRFDLSRLSGYSILENILFRRWPPLPPYIELNWISTLCGEGVRRGHYAVWAEILGRSEYNLNEYLTINYLVCMRKLGELQRVEMLIQQFIQDTGRKGEFYWQGRALIELAIILRYQGRYKEAVKALSKVQAVKDDDLMSKVMLENAQILLDSGDAAGAFQTLLTADQNNPVVLTMTGEALLAMGQFNRSHACFQQAIAKLKDNHREEELGRLYACVGRVNVQLHNHEDAHVYFEAAIALLEKASDWFALGRAQSNMAALLIEQEEFEETQNLLWEAKRLQESMNDRVGLVHTQHNIALLETRLKS